MCNNFRWKQKTIVPGSINQSTDHWFNVSFLNDRGILQQQLDFILLAFLQVWIEASSNNIHQKWRLQSWTKQTTLRGFINKQQTMEISACYKVPFLKSVSINPLPRQINTGSLKKEAQISRSDTAGRTSRTNRLSSLSTRDRCVEAQLQAMWARCHVNPDHDTQTLHAWFCFTRLKSVHMLKPHFHSHC